MITEFQIYCDYQRALSEASQLEKIARDIKVLANGDLENQKGYLERNWQGVAKSIFDGKVTSEVQNLNVISTELTKVADTIRVIAENNYHTEMRALELARERLFSSGS